MPFTREQDIQLIKLVEKNSILYNTNHERYCETGRRDDAWRTISDALHVPAQACKRRWVNIRDNQLRKLKDRRNPNKKGLNYCKYKYEDELAFLIPFYHTFQQTETDDSDKEDFVETSGSIKEETMERFYEEQNNVVLEEKTDDPMSIFTAFRNADTSEYVEARPVRTSNITNQSTDQTFSTSQVNEPDSIKLFLNVVEWTLRKLNPYYLNLAKSKLFQVAQECEQQQILNKGEIPYTKSNETRQ